MDGKTTTKREKKIIYKAAELVATGRPGYSCLAIEKASECTYFGEDLVAKYCLFYEQPIFNAWLGVNHDELKDLRILLLLLFAEAGE